MAIATDFNPARTAMSMPLVMTLQLALCWAFHRKRLCGGYLNAGWAAGLGGIAGGFAQGLAMDAVIFDTQDYLDVPYRFGTNLVHTVIKAGKPVRSKNNK